MILNSPYISGSLTVTGNIIASGSITISGSIASASYAANATSASYAVNATSASYAIDATSASYAVASTSASYAVNATSASFAIQAQTASFANTFTVNSTLTAQTLVVQTITSSVDFVTGSTRFGSLLDNTHVFTGSLLLSGSLSGTNATFSSSASRMMLINSTNANGPYITLQANGSDEFYIGKSNGVGAGSGYYDIYANAAGGGLRFFVSGSASPSLTIALTGATTFNSSDAGGWYSGFSNSSSNFAYMGATAQFANSGGTTTDFGIRSANALAFYTGGGNERMRITSGGNLQVTGSATFSGTVTVASPFTIKALNPYIQWQNAAGTRLGYIQHATDLVMSADTGSIILTNASGNCLTITSTGAASFLNSVSLNSSSNTAGSQGFLLFNYTAANANSRSWKISNDQYEWGDFAIQYSSTQTGAISNSALVITRGGNVGIGTGSPQTLFHLNAPAASNATIYFGVNGTMNGYLGQTASVGSLASSATTGDIILRSQTNLLFTAGGDTTRMTIASGGNVSVSNLLTPDRLSLSTYTSLYGKKVVKADAVSSFAFNLSTMFPEMSSTFTGNVVGCFGVYTIFRAGAAETGTFSISRNSGGAWSVSAFSVQTATGAYSLSNVTGSGTTITMTFNTSVYVIVEVTAMIE